MLVVFAEFLLALFLVVNISTCVTRPENVFYLLMPALVEFSFIVFVSFPLKVSSVSPMLNLGSWACSCSLPFSVPQILRRPRSWLLDFTVFSLFGHPNLSVISACAVVALRDQICALGGSSGSLVLWITCCVHDNAGDDFFVLAVFTRKWGTKCLWFSWTYDKYNILVETCSSHLKQRIAKTILLPLVINPRTCRED